MLRFGSAPAGKPFPVGRAPYSVSNLPQELKFGFGGHSVGRHRLESVGGRLGGWLALGSSKFAPDGWHSVVRAARRGPGWEAGCRRRTCTSPEQATLDRRDERTNKRIIDHRPIQPWLQACLGRHAGNRGLPGPGTGWGGPG